MGESVRWGRSIAPEARWPRHAQKERGPV